LVAATAAVDAAAAAAAADADALTVLADQLSA